MASSSSSSNLLFLGNAMVTIPFGVAAYIAPSLVFGQFGITLDAPAQGLVRGYAITALAYGYVMFQLRNVPSVYHPTLIVASTVFNVGEVLLQSHCYYSDAGFNNMIWTTLSSHAVLGLWSIWTLANNTTKSSVDTKRSS